MDIHSVEIVKTVREFRELEPAWTALAEGAGNPMLRFDWFDCCRQAFDYNLHVIICRRAGEVVAIAPFGQRKGARSRRIVFMDELLCEFHCFLYRDAEALDRLSAALVGLRLPLTLTRLPVDSLEFAAMLRAVHGAPVLYLSTSPSSFNWTALTGTADENTRRLRKRMRSTGTFGPVRIENEQVDAASVAQRLAEFAQLEASGWKGHAGTAIACNPRIRRFWSLYLESAAGAGRVEIGTARIGDTIVAMRILLVDGGRQWEMKIAYDEKFAASSPGTLVLLSQLVHGAKEGRAAHVFLGAAEHWQDRFAPVNLPFRTTRVYPLSIWGAEALFGDILAKIQDFYRNRPRAKMVPLQLGTDPKSPQSSPR